MKWKSHFCHQACSNPWRGLTIYSAFLGILCGFTFKHFNVTACTGCIMSGYLKTYFIIVYRNANNPLSSYENGLIIGIHYSVLTKLYTFNYAKGSNIPVFLFPFHIHYLQIGENSRSIFIVYGRLFM